MSIDARLAEIHALPWDQIPAALEALAREQAATIEEMRRAQVRNALHFILERD